MMLVQNRSNCARLGSADVGKTALLAGLTDALRDCGADVAIIPHRFAGLTRVFEKKEINSNSAKFVPEKRFGTTGTAEEIVKQFGFKQASDTAEFEKIVRKINGNKKSSGFLVSQVMKSSKGKASPKILKEIIKA
ncbi:MAG: hypothetical protein JEZ12_08325 [Desulfobacterium sp.]|nr:hypothetical protein [Desulfobacterium sp.]